VTSHPFNLPISKLSVLNFLKPHYKSQILWADYWTDGALQSRYTGGLIKQATGINFGTLSSLSSSTTLILTKINKNY
jgi:hypothetical protein